MKQKSQNRFLAALLAVAMMLQMLPMLAFAEDAPDAHAVKIDGKEGSYARCARYRVEAGFTPARKAMPARARRSKVVPRKFSSRPCPVHSGRTGAFL